ncbi:MAG: Rv3235 family protein, partial [Actinomycetota bacterium]|nr:Rv3235 family protein [Actinomycetota bacterium]
VPGQHDPDFDPDFAHEATPRAALPHPSAWSARFVQALVEVLWGGRPSAQLLRWTTVDVYVAVQRRASVAIRVPSGRAARPLVRSVRVCEPNDGVAEVCAVVERGDRTTAIALRLEGIDGRWQCSVLELG